VRGGHLPDGGGGAEHTIVLFGGMEGSLSASVPAAYRPRSPSAEMMLVLLMILLYVVRCLVRSSLVALSYYPSGCRRVLLTSEQKMF
jgi:hypothetical protein